MDERPGAYNFSAIEAKWQKYWLDNKTFRAEIDYSRPKYYVLDMFPYPSGEGLHVGHPLGYTASDVIARYKRMRGFNVLHPMGFDAFGLPAEQYALKTGTHPAITTRKNIDRYRNQLRQIGFSYDWDREISTCDESYYQWTQWIFRKLYEKGLAYMDNIPVNWCPELGTVLANEEVVDGKSERGGYDVIRRPMRQWVLRITEYADSLLETLPSLDWNDWLVEMQRNWIGRSEGLRVTFDIAGQKDLNFEIFTTRPDTLFGATYAVLAPEHPLVERVTSDEQRDAVSEYVEAAKNKSDLARQEDADKKTGVFTGGYAVNPANGKEIPIYVADYVLITYGTGAIMAVPAHDERDYAFAKKFNLAIVEVVAGGDISEAAYTGDGTLINSDYLNGLNVEEAKRRIGDRLVEAGRANWETMYKLRDWIFSRQRYWGEPFPIIHTDEGPKLLPESELPVTLPEIEKYQPTPDGEPPLSRAKDWVEVTDPETGKPATRETNTMPQWAGSCWYYLRFTDPHNTKEPWSKEAEEYWMPVDLYVGGAEHAVLHLLYSRFWHHVLHDLDLVSTREPFQKLINQGLLLGSDNQKMSKSLGNVVSIDEFVRDFGADTLRSFEMFMGPIDQGRPWSSTASAGVHRFLNRFWQLVIGKDGQVSERVQNLSEDSDAFPDELRRLTHRTIKTITDDIEGFRFHTAIAALMTLLNELQNAPVVPKWVAEAFTKLLSPFAPHICEELWQRLGHESTISYESWPTYDPELAKRNLLTYAIQVNGKLRETLEADANAIESMIVAQAAALPKVATYLDGKSLQRTIFVDGRLVNFVVR